MITAPYKSVLVGIAVGIGIGLVSLLCGRFLPVILPSVDIDLFRGFTLMYPVIIALGFIIYFLFRKKYLVALGTFIGFVLHVTALTYLFYLAFRGM
jgi:hypothetical protein